jgi:exonuclease V gamma subunit
MDALQEWGLKAELFERILYGGGFPDEETEKKLIQRLKQSGRIPLAGVGKIYFESIKEELKPYEIVFKDVVAGRKQTPVEITLPIDVSVLKGKINNFYEDVLVYVCDSSSVSKHMIRAWIPYLGLLASGYEADFSFIYKKDGELLVEQLEVGSITAKDALTVLQKIAADYRYGHTNWFYFHPELARENMKNIQVDYPDFIAWIEDKMESEYEYRLKDIYLMKAAENGFFAEENFESLRQNVIEFMTPLQTNFPTLFE